MLEQKFMNKARLIGYLLGAAIAAAVVIFRVAAR